jgi:hypothetical protein
MGCSRSSGIFGLLLKIFLQTWHTQSRPQDNHCHVPPSAPGRLLVRFVRSLKQSHCLTIPQQDPRKKSFHAFFFNSSDHGDLGKVVSHAPWHIAKVFFVLLPIVASVILSMIDDNRAVIVPSRISNSRLVSKSAQQQQNTKIQYLQSEPQKV